MEIHVHCDCSIHWPQTKGLSYMKYSHLLSFQHQSQDQSRFLVNSKKQIKLLSSRHATSSYKPLTVYICYSICNLIGAVVKQVISKSRNSTCKLAIAHATPHSIHASTCTDTPNLTRCLYWQQLWSLLWSKGWSLQLELLQGTVTLYTADVGVA